MRKCFFMSHNPEEKQSNLDSNHKTNHLLIKELNLKLGSSYFLLGVVIITFGITVVNNWH